MKFIVPFLLLLSVGVCAQTQSENYIKKTTYNVRTHNGIDGVSGATLVKIKEEDKRHTITYYDGLGRPKQTVAVGVTPSGKDLVTHIGYDGFGRQHRDYLPVPVSGSSGSFRADAEAQTLAYYNTPAFDHTQNPYTERIYEASPLNRVLEVGAPGNAWKADPNSDADRTIKTDHDANGWDDLVRWFDVDFENGNTQRPTLADKGVYPAGQLYKTVVKDENWRHYTYSQDSHKTETYTNKQGQVILKRAYSNRAWHDTYYVYDDYGNQTFVIPPEVQTYASVWQQGDYKYVSLSSYDGLFTTPINDGAGKWGAAYLGSWDKSVRLYYGAYNLSGHTPKNGSHFDLSPMGVDLPAGSLSGWAYYTKVDGSFTRKPITGYLIGNRVSISGLPEEPMKHFRFYLSRHIGELRNDKPLLADQLETMMYHYRYDHRNRPVERKIPGKDWEYIAYDTLDRPVLTADGNMRANSQALKTEYDAFGRVTKTGLVTGVSGSSHNAFKAHIDKPIGTLYSENFYDRYTFDKQGLTLPSHAVTGTQTQGLQTGSRVRVLKNPLDFSIIASITISCGPNGSTSTTTYTDNSKWITTLIGYDQKGRTLYEGTHNPATGVVTQSTHTLDFVGRTTKTTTTQTKGGKTLTKVDDFVYDHAGRLIDHDLTLNGQKEDLVHNRYDELGQLAQKTLGGGLQRVDYAYNVRGWLRHINNPNQLGDDLFGFTLDYGNLYNGNIQRTEWATANDGIKRRYQYWYDGLNRLGSATYYAPGKRWGSYRTWYNYDRNGNIKRLYRSGDERVTIDYLNYAYSGNQLLSVTDNSRNSEGFTDGNTYGFDYLYDSNGNMTRDENKHINVQYNHLNLPIEVYKGQRMKTLRYTYDASGTKHKKVYYGQGVRPQTTTYTPLAVYKNDSLEFVHTPEGYFEQKNGRFIHTYQYKDHLGNNRLSYADSNKNGKIDTPYTSGVTVWEDDFEDKSTGDWESVGAKYGRKITGFDTTKAHSGSKSGYIKLNTNGKWTDYYVHSNEWIAINNTKPTLYRYSGWVFLEPSVYRAEFFLHMKDADETWYYTKFDHVDTTQKGKWVYMEKVVLIPPEIKTFNFRIDADGHYTGTVWYDDLKIEQLDNSQNEIVSETNYYPFGLAHKGYNEQTTRSNLGENWKFNGKELNDELDLGWYDFGARFYDPEINRTRTIDPLADDPSQLDKSPYAMFWNNPIKYIDPTGMISWDWDDDWFKNSQGRIVWHDRTDENFVDKNGEQWQNVGADLEEVKSNMKIPDDKRLQWKTVSAVAIGSPGKGSAGVTILDNDAIVRYNLNVENAGESGVEKIDGQTEITGVNLSVDLSTGTNAPGVQLQSIGGDFGIQKWTPLGKDIANPSPSFSSITPTLSNNPSNVSGRSTLKLGLPYYRLLSKNFTRTPQSTVKVRSTATFKLQYNNRIGVFNTSSSFKF